LSWTPSLHTIPKTPLELTAQAVFFVCVGPQFRVMLGRTPVQAEESDP